MKKYIPVILFLVVISTISCSDKNNNNKGAISLTKDTIAFPLKKNISAQSKKTVLRYFTHKGKPYLGYLNPMMNEIILFDFNTQKMVKRIKYQKRGPNGVGSIRGFYALNFDSIFVTSPSAHRKSVFLTDTSASIIEKITFDILEFEDELNNNSKKYPIGIYPLTSRLNNPLIKVNEKLHVRTNIQYMHPKDKNVSNHTLGVIYNTQQNTKKKSPFHYPDINYIASPMVSSHGYFNGRFFYSFATHDDVFVYSKDTVMQSYTSKSAFRKKPFTKIKNNPGKSIKILQKEALKQPNYQNIIHDPYRNVLYRFFVPGITVKDDDNISLLSQCKKTFSIMILNEKFEVIGETLMPEMTLSPNLWFINKYGLYIARHLAHPNYDPDYLVFHKLQFKRNN